MNNLNSLFSKNDSSPSVKFLLPNMTSPSPIPGDSIRFSSATKSRSSTLFNQTLNRSTFNPILTPKGDRGASMMLLSPSRSIVETLTSLATTTGHQLEKIWDEVGYSPDDRASQLNDLLIKFKEICDEKVSEEKGVAETFRQTIIEAKDEMLNTAAALKADIDLTMLGEYSSTQTLTDELATLEAALEGLRAASNVAREELKESQDFIIEAHNALNIEIDVAYKDITSDLTSDRRAFFRAKKSEMKDELSSRMNAVIQLVRDCQQLMNDLRMEPEKSDSDLDRRISGSLVRSKDGSFMMASKFRSETCVGITSQTLEELTHYVAELHGEKRRRKEKLQHMGSEIAILWEKLRVPENEQIAFTKSVQGLGTDTLSKGENELKRLRLLKSQMIVKLVEESREAIKDLWDQINANDKLRSSFLPFQINDIELFSDSLLDEHEEYINHLAAKLEQVKPILRLIERRECIIRERTQYEELQKDPERLKQRGAALTRQLLEEEKMAKRIKKELPRLTSLLIEKLDEWKELHQEDFVYESESYLETIDRQEEQWNQYKVEELHRKLKKKQEESSIENRFGATSLSGALHQPMKLTGLNSRVLAETYRQNENHQRSRSRSRDPVRKAPARDLGQRQLSTKI